MKWVLLDEIIDCVPGQWLVGRKCFPSSQDFFEDHFPGFPIVPGVLQVEMIAAACGRALRMLRPDIITVLGSIKDAKFFSQIPPEAECIVNGKILRARDRSALAQGSIEVDGKRVAQATLLYGILPRTHLSLRDGYVDLVIEQWLKKKKKNARPSAEP